MNITKLGHCCLLLEEQGITFLTDPGVWTKMPEDLGTIDAVIITHEHADHFHIPSLQAVLSNNPSAVVYANTAVGALLTKENIPFILFEHGQTVEVKGVQLKGFGEHHALIYPSIPSVINTGFLLAGRFFYPGDAFYVPQVPVEILALPVAGPWMKISEAIDYAQEVKPKITFPVHDGMLTVPGPFHSVPQLVLSKAGLDFRPLLAGEQLSL